MPRCGALSSLTYPLVKEMRVIKTKSAVVSTLVILILLAAALIGWTLYHRDQDDSLRLYGNVDIRSVNMGFRVAGRLASLTVDEGDKVKRGEPLGLLDPAPYQIALRRAQANVAALEAQYDLMLAGYRDEEIAQSAAQVAQAQSAFDYAQRFYQRQQALWASRTISANDLQNAQTNYQQAQATLQAAKDRLSQYRKGNRPQQIAAAQGELQQAKALLAEAQLNLDDTTLIAPSDGTILTRSVEPGTMLSAGSSVVTISLVDPVWIRAYVNEVHLGDAIPGRKVLIYTDSRPDKPYHGQIGFVSPTAEFTPKTVETPALRTDLVYRIRIVVSDADAALRQGMPATVIFPE